MSKRSLPQFIHITPERIEAIYQEFMKAYNDAPVNNATRRVRLVQAVGILEREQERITRIYEAWGQSPAAADHASEEGEWTGTAIDVRDIWDSLLISILHELEFKLFAKLHDEGDIRSRYTDEDRERMLAAGRVIAGELWERRQLLADDCYEKASDATRAPERTR